MHKPVSILCLLCQLTKFNNQPSKEIRMKILEWMHHKFRHNSIKPFKDLNTGNSCIRLSAQTSLDDQDPYTKPNYNSRDGFNSLKQPKQEEEKYFGQFEAKKEEETSAVISELFHGFLTIGTLGSDASIIEPETPTFATPLENITDGRITVTENHLKLINYELEKFLEAESKEEGSDESSARNSNVSTITLGGKQMERAEDEDYWKTMVCPLQGYLFGSSIGSSIELPEPKTELKKEKASLGELFHRAKIATENCTVKRPSEEIPKKHKHMSAKHFMKKMITKLNPSSKSSYRSAYADAPDSLSTKRELGNATDSLSTTKKLRKVMRMFHRKIHPESSMAAREFARSKKCKSKNTPKEGGCASGNLTQLGGDSKRFPQWSMSMEGIHCSKKNVNSPQESSPSCNNLRGKGEHWIKIDDDYLVLELQL